MSRYERQLIINPAAGSGRAVDRVERYVHDHPSLNVHTSKNTADFDEAVREACEQGVDDLLIAGGDGTVHQAVNAIMAAEHRPRLGVLPCGSANDLASALWIDSVAEAIQAIEADRSRKIDLIRFETDATGYLINAATGGFSRQIHELLDEETKQWWGRFAYIRAAAEATVEPDVFALKLVYDDDELTVDAHAVMVLNGRCAGGVCLLPLADPGDRWLDVVVVEAVPPTERVALFAAFTAGRQLDHAAVHHFRCRRAEIKGDPPIGFIGDGEVLTPTPDRFELVPEAIAVFIGEHPGN